MNECTHGQLARSCETCERDARIAELESELSVHARDTARLDWLADPSNAVGGVTLPREIVLRNVHSLRDAIDEAMSQCT